MAGYGDDVVTGEMPANLLQQLPANSRVRLEGTPSTDEYQRVLSPSDQDTVMKKLAGYGMRKGPNLKRFEQSAEIFSEYGRQGAIPAVIMLAKCSEEYYTVNTGGGKPRSVVSKPYDDKAKRMIRKLKTCVGTEGVKECMAIYQKLVNDPHELHDNYWGLVQEEGLTRYLDTVLTATDKAFFHFRRRWSVANAPI